MAAAPGRWAALRRARGGTRILLACMCVLAMDSPAAPYRRGGQSSLGVAAATGAINASPLESLIPALSSLHTPVRGEVDDTSCNVEEVERANSQQLGALLNDVMNTSFFSLFKVNLEEQCKFWRPTTPGTAEGAATDDDDHSGSESDGECGNEIDAPSLFGGGPMGSSFSSSSPGGKVKACDLDTGDGDDSGTIAPKFTFHSTTDPVDRQTAVGTPDFSHTGPGADCEVPEFWLDMCSDLSSSTSTAGHLDLRRNPERWTGYNGSKIWAAIYEENCFSKGGVSDMCYEERVLYRMLSGMHASINIHIALNYFPPSRAAKRTAWAPNAGRFDQLFAEHPERLKNLHFAFVVTLRAVRKASAFLRDYDYAASEGAVDDSRTRLLVHRFLDTHILSSCADVFDAFDESLMFGRGESPSTVATLKQNFKGVFQNITKLMDCVSCQKCKLHGKLALLGVGTALKILLVPERLIPSTLNREEVVALINTAGKFSQAIEGIKDLQRLNWEEAYFKEAEEKKAESKRLTQMREIADAAAAASVQKLKDARQTPQELPPLQKDELADVALGMVLSLHHAGSLTEAEESSLITRILARDTNMLILAKQLQADPIKFRKYALASVSAPSGTAEVSTRATEERPVDAVVVGAGLAGLTTALTLVDRGANVVLVDKNKFTGGNSAYASSGINAVTADGSGCAEGDSVALYANDTIRSSGRDVPADANETLASVLASRSYGSLEWFRTRVNLPLEVRGQMGGHSAPRTYRPSTGMAGSEMVHAITKIVKSIAKDGGAKGSLRLVFGARLQELITGSKGEITGVRLANVSTSGDVGPTFTIEAPNVVLATGGYAADVGGDSLIKRHRPELVKFQTTNGPFATGDGHKVALAAGAGGVDLDQVQVHPTAFAGSSQKEGDRLTLCAEILRGVGAILVDADGKRFANELGKRDYMVAEMSKAKSKDLTFALILPPGGAEEANKHVPHYKKKGLLIEYANVSEVAQAIGVPESTLAATFAEYTRAAQNGTDAFGKVHFNNVQFGPTDGPYHVGWVTPALHYSLGGIAIDTKGRVKRAEGTGVVPGLYAAGEITGGVHGVNRLGGNALTECVVFGQLVGETIELASAVPTTPSSAGEKDSAPAMPSDGSGSAAAAAEPAKKRAISSTELALHNTAEDCWIAAYGDVYDFTEFVEEHPGGVDTIMDHAGMDGTEVFDAVHTRGMLDEFEPIGVLQE
eukprot:m.34421 g.34421  ORF g.34421 m.34421 type:complete len:1215 (+) comp5137_c0_seq2:283-3927(+)